MTRSIHAGTVSLISQAFRKLELTLPRAYTKALADIDADRERLAAMTAYDSGALAEAVLEALKAGTDPASSEDVRRNLTAQQLVSINIGDTARGKLDDRTLAVVEQHSATILAAMGKQLATFDATLATAREVLPAGTDISDPSSASSVPPKHLPAWGNARATLDHIDRIAQTWRVISSAVHSVSFNPRQDTPLIVASLSAAQLDALGYDPKASAVALAGHTLSLATFDEFTERKARVSKDRQAAQDAQPTFADEYRRTQGIGIGRLGHGQVFTAP